MNHLRHRAAIAEIRYTPYGHGEIEKAVRLLPDAEFALCSIGTHIFTALTLIGEFPIMDGACSVCRQMGYPAPFQHLGD